jgi:rubrerythrin
MRANAVAVVVLGVGLLSASCKRTVEGEDQAWNANLRHVQELSAQYPGFANALTEQKKRAEEAMAAARTVGDKEQAARKMGEANALLGSGFVSTLGQLDSRTRALRAKLVTATTDAEHGSDQAGAKVATDDAQRILRNADDALKSGAGDPDAAGALLRKIDGDLTSASSNLDRVIASAKSRKTEATKAAAAAAGGSAAAAASGGSAAPVKVTWKCTYCDHINDDSAKKCPNCGAPRPDPNAPPKGGVKKKK